MLAYKLAATPFEYGSILEQYPELGTETELEGYLQERGLKIPVWSAADVAADYSRVGLPGSPTKVVKVESVVLTSEGSKEFACRPWSRN